MVQTLPLTTGTTVPQDLLARIRDLEQNLNALATLTGAGGVLSIASGGTGQSSANSALNALLPSQTSNSGKYLTTDGSNASWGSISVTGIAGSTSNTVTAVTSLRSNTTAPSLRLERYGTVTAGTNLGAFSFDGADTTGHLHSNSLAHWVGTAREALDSTHGGVSMTGSVAPLASITKNDVIRIDHADTPYTGQTFGSIPRVTILPADFTISTTPQWNTASAVFPGAQALLQLGDGDFTFATSSRYNTFFNQSGRLINSVSGGGPASLTQQNWWVKNDRGGAYNIPGYVGYIQANLVYADSQSVTVGDITDFGSQVLLSTAQTTTVASGSNGVDVSTFAGAGTLNVASTTGFLSSGTIFVRFNNNAFSYITYTGKTGTTFTGCTTSTSFGYGMTSATLSTGLEVTQFSTGGTLDGSAATFKQFSALAGNVQAGATLGTRIGYSVTEKASAHAGTLTNQYGLKIESLYAATTVNTGIELFSTTATLADSATSTRFIDTSATLTMASSTSSHNTLNGWRNQPTVKLAAGKSGNAFGQIVMFQHQPTLTNTAGSAATFGNNYAFTSSTIYQADGAAVTGANGNYGLSHSPIYKTVNTDAGTSQTVTGDYGVYDALRVTGNVTVSNHYGLYVADATSTNVTGAPYTRNAGTASPVSTFSGNTIIQHATPNTFSDNDNGAQITGITGQPTLYAGNHVETGGVSRMSLYTDAALTNLHTTNGGEVGTTWTITFTRSSAGTGYTATTYTPAVTNMYGVYVEPLTIGTNRYAGYFAGSYFDGAGNLTLGTNVVANGANAFRVRQTTAASSNFRLEQDTGSALAGSAVIHRLSFLAPTDGSSTMLTGGQIRCLNTSGSAWSATSAPSKMEFYTNTTANPPVSTLALTLGNDQSATFAGGVTVGSASVTQAGDITAQSITTQLAGGRVGDLSKTNNTLADALTFTGFLNSTKYRVRGMLIVDVGGAGATCGMKFTFHATSSLTVSQMNVRVWTIRFDTGALAGTTLWTEVTALDAAFNDAVGVNNAVYLVYVEGTLTTSHTGGITLQFAQHTTNATAALLKAGSHLSFEPISISS